MQLIEPCGGFNRFFEWIIDGEQNSIGTHFQHGVDKRRRAEIPADGQIEVVFEILGHLSSSGDSARRLADAMIYAPDHERQTFAQVAEDDIETRVSIKESARHQAQRVRRGFDAESPRRTHEPGMAIQNRLSRRQRVARMQI